MKIRFLKKHRHHKIDDIADYPLDIARDLIKLRVAESLEKNQAGQIAKKDSEKVK